MADDQKLNEATNQLQGLIKNLVEITGGNRNLGVQNNQLLELTGKLNGKLNENQESLSGIQKAQKDTQVQIEKINTSIVDLNNYNNKNFETISQNFEELMNFTKALKDGVAETLTEILNSQKINAKICESLQTSLTAQLEQMKAEGIAIEKLTEKINKSIATPKVEWVLSENKKLWELIKNTKKQ